MAGTFERLDGAYEVAKTPLELLRHGEPVAGVDIKALKDGGRARWNLTAFVGLDDTARPVDQLKVVG